MLANQCIEVWAQGEPKLHARYRCYCCTIFYAPSKGNIHVDHAVSSLSHYLSSPLGDELDVARNRLLAAVRLVHRGGRPWVKR